MAKRYGRVEMMQTNTSAVIASLSCCPHVGTPSRRLSQFLTLIGFSWLWPSLWQNSSSVWDVCCMEATQGLISKASLDDLQWQCVVFHQCLYCAWKIHTLYCLKIRRLKSNHQCGAKTVINVHLHLWPSNGKSTFSVSVYETEMQGKRR